MPDRTGDPALDDPFFRVVRERHPDIDLVMLPPVVLPPTVQDPAEEARAQALLAKVDETLDAVRLAVRVASGLSMEISASWSTGSATGSRRRIARAVSHDVPPAEAVSALRAIGNRLLALGWDARPYADGSARLRGVHRQANGELSCEAVVGEGTLQVIVQTGPLALTDRVADALEMAR
jgi:hypothetical protein